MWIHRAVQRQNAHSWYLFVVQCLLGATLVVDLVFHRNMSNTWLLWSLMCLCVGGACLVFALGAKLPVWVGLVGVGAFLASQSYFLSLEDDAQSVISSVQQFPLIAFYLGWFSRPRWAIPLVGLGTLLFGTTMALNPLFAPEGKLGPPIAVHGLLILLFCFFAGSFLWHRNARAAGTDLLTGVRTRGMFLEDLEESMRARGAGEISVIAIDFDGLKQINDSRGHAAGDRVLKEATRQWGSLLRSGDFVGRLGGDEFVIALPGASLQSARHVDDRLRVASPHEWSSGVAASFTGESAEALLNRADAELYRQKRKTGLRHAE